VQPRSSSEPLFLTCSRPRDLPVCVCKWGTTTWIGSRISRESNTWRGHRLEMPTSCLISSSAPYMQWLIFVGLHPLTSPQPLVPKCRTSKPGRLPLPKDPNHISACHSFPNSGPRLKASPPAPSKRSESYLSQSTLSQLSPSARRYFVRVVRCRSGAYSRSH